MGEYLNDVFVLIEQAFKNWIFDKVFFPTFLAILTGYFISNFITFRDQMRRAYDEIRFLRRRVYFRRDGGKVKEIADWETVANNFDVDLEQITREMQYCGFFETAQSLAGIVNDIRSEFQEFRAEANEAIYKSAQLDFKTTDSERVYRESILANFRMYWILIHPAMEARFQRIRPSFWEMINAPRFTRINAAIIALTKPFIALAGWIDSKYSPRRSDCGTCCNNCSKTV